MTPVDLLAMTLLGLVGSTHCLAMCSGFAVCLAARKRDNTLWYHLGRWLSYVVLGALMGALGLVFKSRWDDEAGRGLALVAGLCMVAMGLALTGWLPASGGWNLARWLRPLLVAPSSRSAFGVGALTGLLPCGLLYAALARAAAAGSPLSGALLMAAFWTGTTPLLALGAWGIAGRTPWRWWPRLAGALVLGVGLATMAHAWQSSCPLCTP
ncbi:MAG TPA: sulfite exporter TauE/SafE family protein [Candidatus Xenobia bacterium]|jgi:hypothetical protein